jgi:hypothetical protein
MTLFFLVYINDMPGYARSQIRLFVDDCLMYRKVSSTSDCTQLQEDLLWVGGSQTAAAYSIVGRTMVVNARSLADWGQVPMFLLKKAKVLLGRT